MDKYSTQTIASSSSAESFTRDDRIVSGAVPASLQDLRNALDRQRIPRQQEKVVTLGSLRDMVGKTQSEVAKSLGLAQGNVSKLENRGDLRLSSLRSYLNALDVQAQISVIYKGRSYLLDLGDSEINN